MPATPKIASAYAAGAVRTARTECASERIRDATPVPAKLTPEIAAKMPPARALERTAAHRNTIAPATTTGAEAMTNHHCADRETAVASSAIAPEASSTSPRPRPPNATRLGRQQNGAKHPSSDQSCDAHTRRGRTLHEEQRQPMQRHDGAAEADGVECDPCEVER